MPATPTRTIVARPAETAIPETPAAAKMQYSLPDGTDAGKLALRGYQQLAEEAAVAISYNGVNHAVMMATPEDLEEYALGFSIGNGIVQAPKQILDIQIHRDGETVCLNIQLSHRAHHALKLVRRSLAGNSGCGLCGIQALSQALAPLPRSSPEAGYAPLPPSAYLIGLRERIQHAQHHLQRSGAMHAALYVDASGKTLLCREDIGRHNALDKLVGACLQQGVQLQFGFVAVTSRCSLELVQKAVRAGVGTLVSLSSPTDMCVRWARDSQLNLLHQPAQGPARVYSPLAICGKDPI